MSTSGSSKTLFSLDTELRPLRAGPRGTFEDSRIFLLPGIGMEELRVWERGGRELGEWIPTPDELQVLESMSRLWQRGLEELEGKFWITEVA